MQVTLQDIANRLGLHVTTVSKALNGNPAIALQTRDRVASLARELGYVPDPRLRALADYRAAKRQQGYRATLAWVHNHAKLEPMQRFPMYGDYWLGAKERAARLGYGLEAHWVEDGEKGMKQLFRTLRSRGVPGIVMAPQARERVIADVGWDAFSVVSIGFTLKSPRFHRVSVDHFRLIETLLERLRSEGYQRIGCYLDEEEQERMEGRMLASAQQHRDVFIKLYKKPDRSSFLSWRTRNKLDALICGSLAAVQWLRDKGVLAKTVAYAYQENALGVPGMYHNNRLIGDHAIALLDSMVRRGERGMPEDPVEMLVEAKWREASPLPAQSI